MAVEPKDLRGVLAQTSPTVAAADKVAAEPAKLAAFRAGEPIFPTTLELDLTTECTRSCPECPSTTAPVHRTMSRELLDWLLGELGGGTPGLLLTGGEPTMAPLFGDALALARHRGFREIAVVTNGSRLDRPEVTAALLEHVTTIRLSLYDWTGPEGVEHAAETLARIERLRATIDRAGSRLRIGVSALTSTDRVGRLPELARAVRDAGAHWLYFHPLCRKWGQGTPELDDQDLVLDTVAAIADTMAPELAVCVCHERYAPGELCFNGYHGAHFLMVVGADGQNYLAPEVKYQEPHIIADLTSRPAGFLDDPARLRSIAAVHSAFYPARGSRHRSVLYSDWLERRAPQGEPARRRDFLFPFIL